MKTICRFQPAARDTVSRCVTVITLARIASAGPADARHVAGMRQLAQEWITTCRSVLFGELLR